MCLRVFLAYSSQAFSLTWFEMSKRSWWQNSPSSISLGNSFKCLRLASQLSVLLLSPCPLIPELLCILGTGTRNVPKLLWKHVWVCGECPHWIVKKFKVINRRSLWLMSYFIEWLYFLGDGPRKLSRNCFKCHHTSLIRADKKQFVRKRKDLKYPVLKANDSNYFRKWC